MPQILPRAKRLAFALAGSAALVLGLAAVSETARAISQLCWPGRRSQTCRSQEEDRERSERTVSSSARGVRALGASNRSQPCIAVTSPW